VVWRALSDNELDKYLADRGQPRHAQHALVQVSERILRGDKTAARWYPQVRVLAAHPAPELRATAAWVMGQDNQSAEFHEALRGMLADNDPLVRRNAALSLVRFADASGRPELVEMLGSYDVPAPAAGTLAARLKPDDAVNPGTLLGKIERGGEEVEVRSLLPGRVERWLKPEGARVEAGESVVVLAPAEEQVWEGLRALLLVGEPEDVGSIEAYTHGHAEMSPRIEQQARYTVRAIRERAESRQ